MNQVLHRPSAPAARRCGVGVRCVLVAMASVFAAAQGDASPPRQRHQPQEDEILLISTRAVGSRCSPAAMEEGLRCERFVRGGRGGARWEPLPWTAVTQPLGRPLPTVIYVHGNRVDSGEDKTHGLTFYRSIADRKPDAAAMRFVIWSWPSEKIRGPLRDYQVKAARTKPVGWQLAWTIDQLPAESPLSLVGYSYGARVVTGALHLVAGGAMDQLKLSDRRGPHRPPMRAALLAAAVDADWIRPGGYHGRALESVDQLLLVNNTRDPAMRFYHLALGGSRPQALGYAGPFSRGTPQDLLARVRSVDATEVVGRHHALAEYLTAAGPVGEVLEQIVQAPTPIATTVDSIAGRNTDAAQ